MNRYLISLVQLLTCALFSITVGAQKREGVLNKLFGPGPLIEGHADLENGDCLKCHDTGQGVPDSKCLACHKEIRADVEGKRGFHGLHKNTCIQCHSDHKGRAYDSLAINDSAFDHSTTGYKLVGAHAKVQCAECHDFKRTGKPVRQDGIRYFGTWPKLKQQDCRACHEDTHGKNISAKFQNGQCYTCHTQDAWAIKKFDHDKLTNYPLRGQHAKIDCLACHKQDAKLVTQNKKQFKWTGLKTDCLDCHKDFHVFNPAQSKKLGNLNQCLNCHNETKWEQTHGFDHNKNTRYAITGKHKEVSCRECHVNAKKNEKPVGRYHWAALETKTCENCHASPHTKSFPKELLKKKCTECHFTDDWFIPTRTKKGFDHDKTRFKLTGRHFNLDCMKCHAVNGKEVYKFASFKQNFCIDCHNSPHKDQFHKEFAEQACNECHTTKDFVKTLPFDHAKTKFILKGAHKELKCNDCHTEVKREVAATKEDSKKSAGKGNSKKTTVWHKYIFAGLEEKACMTCHADFHQEQLSKNCTDCHNEKEWISPRYDHNKQSRYKLVGKHSDVKCSECHKPEAGKTVAFGTERKKYPVVHYKPMSTDCQSCHADDDPHKGQFGSACNKCHVERGWKISKDFHKNFLLHGQHFALTCTECHIDDRRLAGMGDNCIGCHQKDDVHRGTLPNCADCHRQQMWDQTKFRHAMTFPLRGAHRTLDCVECHKNNVYQGTPNNCFSCHWPDAAAVTAPVHGVTTHMNCFNCHNQFTFAR